MCPPWASKNQGPGYDGKGDSHGCQRTQGAKTRHLDRKGFVNVRRLGPPRKKEPPGLSFNIQVFSPTAGHLVPNPPNPAEATGLDRLTHPLLLVTAEPAQHDDVPLRAMGLGPHVWMTQPGTGWTVRGRGSMTEFHVSEKSLAKQASSSGSRGSLPREGGGPRG